MPKGRLEAFSDGVLAILITIMVLELKVPHGTDFAALKPLLPVFLTYILSFVYLGIYWNNHHHMLHATARVNGRILWANLHLLFWLSLVPFTTGWMGENHFAPLPTAVYGAVLLLAGLAYLILAHAIVAEHGPRLPARGGPRPRPEGQAVARPLRDRDSAGLREPVDFGRDLRRRGDDLAGARPAHRGTDQVLGTSVARSFFGAISR